MSTDETAPPAQPTFAERWVADFRLLAVLCARTYGSIAIVGLIGLNALGWALTQQSYFALGAALGVGSAFAAYVNFTAVAEDRSAGLVALSIYASIGAGIMSAVIFLAVAAAL